MKPKGFNEIPELLPTSPVILFIIILTDFLNTGPGIQENQVAGFAPPVLETESGHPGLEERFRVRLVAAYGAPCPLHF
jgi:hypothetical protein